MHPQRHPGQGGIELGEGGLAVWNNEDRDLLGTAVSGDGDINGDGISDVILGAPGSSLQRGRAYVMFGGQP